MNRVEAIFAFQRALERAQAGRRSQFSVPGEAAVLALASDALTLRHAALAAQGYALAAMVPCRLLTGRGFSLTFTYRHPDADQPTEILRLTLRDRGKRPKRRARR